MRWVCLLQVLVLVAHGAETEITTLACNNLDEYLDTTNFECRKCASPPNTPADSGNLNASIIVPDRLKVIRPYESTSYTVSTSCKCASGWMVDPSHFNSTDACSSINSQNNYWCDSIACFSCPQASSVDSTVCMSCGVGNSSTVVPANTTGASIVYSTATGRCQCKDPTHVLRERSAMGELLPYKICETCPQGYLLSALYRVNMEGADPLDIMEQDYYICKQCPHPAMIVSNNKCVCSLPNDPNPQWDYFGASSSHGATCVLSSESIYGQSSGFAQIEYTSVIPSSSSGRRMLRRELATASGGGYTTYIVKNSALFTNNLPLAAAKCRYLRTVGDVDYCQTLASLCVLQHYDSSTLACSLMNEIAQQRPTWNAVSWNWRVMTPWIQYDGESARNIKTDLGIQNVYSFNMQTKPGTVDYMQLVLAKYALNGTFLGWSNVTTQFEYCTPTANTVPRWIKFGYGYSNTYECNLFNLLSYFPEPVMYDMYLIDAGNNNMLYPIPVRNRNYRQKGSLYPNQNGNTNDEEDDKFTRRFFLYDQISSKTTANGEAAVIRYAKSIVLTTTVQQIQVDKIYPPVLDIQYEERMVSDLFAQGTDEQGVPLESATTTYLSFTVEYTENYSSFWNTVTALFAISISCVVLVSGLRMYNWTRRNSRIPGDAPIDFPFLIRGFSFLFSTYAQIFYWFLFAYSFYFFLFFKMQDNINLMLPVSRESYGSDNDYFGFYMTLQVCFIGQICRMCEIVIQQSNVDIFFLDWEKPRGKVASKRGDGTKSKFAPVSVWRTIFMTNEWNEMQKERRYDIQFALLLLATILVAADFQYAATPTPNYKDLTPGPLNIVLRFFNTSFWFLLIANVQIMWKWAIQDRYFTEPPTHSFVDLCTMAKISVFVLDEKYHGYYLHCRSQHEYADGSMLEIARQLRQEEEGLTTDRGLLGSPSAGLQTFEIYVTGDWKRQYDHIYRTMMQEELQGSQSDTSSFLMRVVRRKGAKPAPEKLVKASRKLNAFLRNFVDQATADFPIQHREQTVMHRFLKTPPEMVGTKNNIFFPDTFYGYDKVLFYGETWNLLLFNVLSITTLEYWTEDIMVSIFVAYLFDRAFLIWRELMGNANLSSKTLVDDRFLI